MTEGLLQIGELAARAGVSPRTVDFYTGLGLLSPIRRSGGNFRLYQPTDVQRIAAIRQLEAQGIRLEDIAHVLSPTPLDHSQCATTAQTPCPADPAALSAYLTSLDTQVRALQDVARDADDPRTRGVLAALTMRAHGLIAAAVLLAGDLLPHTDVLPPM